MDIQNNKIIGEISTEELVFFLRGYALAVRATNQELNANIITLAADRLQELDEKLGRAGFHGICDR